MNLIAFPHYTCGGLLCDILNDQWSQVGSHGGIINHYHSIGKIGDSNSVQEIFNVIEFNNRVAEIEDKVSSDNWISTHVWPELVDKTKFGTIIIVSTDTYRSKIYRWLRCCYHYYEPSRPWIEAKKDQTTYIDKVRETAKNYLKSFRSIQYYNVVNVEFSDVVENNTAFTKLISHTDWKKHLDRWQQVNGFLYGDIWNNFYVKRFHEAEHEVLTKSAYVYQ